MALEVTVTGVFGKREKIFILGANEQWSRRGVDLLSLLLKEGMDREVLFTGRERGGQVCVSSNNGQRIERHDEVTVGREITVPLFPKRIRVTGC